MSADQDRDDAVDAEPDEAAQEAAGEGTDIEDVEADEEGHEGGEPRPAWRTPVFVTLRAVVVVAVAVVGYVLVVPGHPVERGRLAHLVVSETGLADLPGQPAHRQEEPAAKSGVASLADAAKRQPDRTGIWVSQWSGTGASSSNVAAVVVFLNPSPADAAKTMKDLLPQTVDSKTSQSYSRSATFTTTGVAGSQGALFTNSSPQPGQPSHLATVIWQQGTTVGLVEEIADTSTQPDTESLARREATLLRQQEPGFSLKVTTYPLGETIAWIAVAFVVLVAVVGGPVLVGRRRRKREADHQAFLDAQVRGHAAIAKRRRSVGP